LRAICIKSEREARVSFIDELLESGGHFIIERIEGGATLKPASPSDTDLRSFQAVVARVREHAGHGYRIFREHASSEHAEEYVDLVIVQMDG
jgi:hypothetical protein